MSRADALFLQNCRDILDHGVWDTDQAVRPRWEDGTPAHTVKKFGIVNRYDLREEFPILTLRRTYWKTAVDELLWIWQKKSNNIHDLRSQDMLAANNWNVVQYAVLVHMLAQVSGLIPGELVHVIADAHIYDRHVPIIEKMLTQTPSPAPVFRMDPSVTDFYAFTRDSFSLEGYTPAPFEDKIPIAI